MERNVLGKGLSALIPEGAQPKERIQDIAIEKIKASTFQPRTRFSEERLKELAESIKEKGVIQPILLRQNGATYEIIAGERRFRATKSLGYAEIPAIVKNVKDEDLLEMSLIENIQREELNKIEEAKAYQRLANDFKLTHETIAKRVSKDRSTVTNLLRVLELSNDIQQLIETDVISMGHAKCLISMVDARMRLKVCRKIIARNLSVRQTENLVREMSNPLARRPKKKDIHIASVEDKLQHRFGTRVQIKQGKKRGKVVIDYYSQDDLSRVLSILMPTA